MTANIGVISYTTAAAAYLFLFMLLLSGWRGRAPGALLALACLICALWTVAVAYPLGSGTPAGALAGVLEIARNAAWCAFLLALLGVSRHDSARPSSDVRVMAAGLTLFFIFLIAATPIFSAGRLAAGAPDYLTGIVAREIMAVVGMVLVEQLYRNAHPEQRWGIKFLCLGVGGMFAYDFYLYSDAMLFKRVDGDLWAARGFVNAGVVPLIAVAAARNPKWSLDVSVSRRILFQSSALFGAGMYLVVMSAAGYYIRYFGGKWGSVLQVGFLFGALILLLGMLFSGTLRAWLKVFLSKHFFSYKYDYREEWLRFTRTLSEGEPGVRLMERSIQAIAELVESPGGALWLGRESGSFERQAHWNMPAAGGVESPGSAFGRFLENRQWVINLDEYRAQPEIYDGLELPGWLTAIPRAWLVVPLILHEQLLGFVVLARSRGQISLNWEVSDLLKTAGRQAASYLAQLEAAKALLVARQFESFNRMSAFVVHDLKNLVSQLSLLVSNAEKHRNNPEFQRDMIGTVEHSVEKMKRLLLQLRSGQVLDKPAPLSLDEILGRAVEAKSGVMPSPALEITDVGLVVMAHRERLERVIGHLIQNAIEATPPDGRVVARLAKWEKFAIVEIADTGSGMSGAFIRDSLFKPFESTKATGMGIGTYESREYVRELGGSIDVESREARGTTLRVSLPLCVPDLEGRSGAPCPTGAVVGTASAVQSGCALKGTRA
ncbi:MAG: PEP-CTERM system histidine kinase PrsK [Sulfuricella sp.]|nr:PEP-CTERM system histidine kinase PrsK [Sulfuricella sp.]